MEEIPEVVNYVSKYNYTGGNITDFIKSKKLHENQEFLIGLAVILGVSLLVLKRYFDGDNRKIKPDVSSFMNLDNNINIHFLPYKQNLKQTDISEMEFYQNIIRQYGEGKFMLTNGANERIDKVGSGTTKAISGIDEGFFDHIKFQNLNVHEDEKLKNYLEKHELFDKFISSDAQKCTVSTNDHKAGSVFYIENNIETTEKEVKNYVAGIYHIKGINFQGIPKDERIKKENLSVLLVKTYITKILEHFAGKKEVKFLVLSPIPGYLYAGSVITERAIYDAVMEFIKQNGESLKDKVIILGFNKHQEDPKKGGEDSGFVFYAVVLIILIILIMFLIYKLLENKPGIYINVVKRVPGHR